MRELGGRAGERGYDDQPTAAVLLGAVSAVNKTK